MKVVFKYSTKVSLARPNSKSARTTIPKEVMQFLNLEIGDNINWVVEYSEGTTEVKLEKIE